MIFYFSGTGNSRYVARKLADRGERVVSMADALKNVEMDFTLKQDERVGFVTPTYFLGLPTIVVSFLKNLTLGGPGRHYVYTVATCGSNTGRANKQLALLLKEKGIGTNAAFGVRMVDTYLPMFKIPERAKIDEILEKADEDIEEIRGHITRKESGEFNPYIGPVPGVLFRVMYHFYRHGRETKYFTVNNDCIGCKVCEMSCPAQAIRYYAKKPHWVKDTCALCMGCINQCPMSAINYNGKTEGKGRYYNNKKPW